MESLKKELNSLKEGNESREENQEKSDSGGGGEIGFQELQISPHVFGDLSPQALNYIQQLQSELSNVKEVSFLLFSIY